MTGEGSLTSTPGSPNPPDMDWGRYSEWRLVLPPLVILVIGYIPGPLLMSYWYFSDRNLADVSVMDRVLPVLLLIGYVIGFLLLLYHVVFASARVVLGTEGVHIMTWTGRRILRWSDVTRARVATHKNSATLVLQGDGLGRIRICLSDYRRGRSLFEDIRRRLPIAVEAHPAQLALLRDIDNAGRG